MRKTLKLQRFFSLLCMLFLMISIFCFSAQPREESNDVSSGFTAKIVGMVTHFSNVSEATKQDMVLQLNGVIRKCAHFSIYAALGITSLLFFMTYPVTIKKAWLIALALCLLYAASDEFHQLFVPGRGAQVRDVLLDFCGAFVGSGAVACWKMCLKKEKNGEKEI